MHPRLVYSKDYCVDIGSHVFLTSKYVRVRERLLRDSAGKDIEFLTPPPARDEDVLRVHTQEYVKKLTSGTLSKEDIILLELPYSKALVDASFLCCGGTILASRVALEDGIGIHIGGGFHHAFPDHGEGFCVLNDIAVAIKRLLNDGVIERALVVDCDLHQGNGTAAIFSRDKKVFTFSIHQENNYPFLKPEGSLDIGLPDRADDREYMKALRGHIPKIVSDFKPDFMMYVAGADPYKEDQLGGLALTKDGLRKRDEFIYEKAADHGIPVCVVLAGGYAFREEDTVEIHCNTVMTGIRLLGSAKGRAHAETRGTR